MRWPPKCALRAQRARANAPSALTAGSQRGGTQAAREGTRALLAARPAPTALVCGNDVLAWGALLECQAQGIEVPQALSVVGFDDLEMSRHWQPALTTMHVPTERMWTLAADYLLDRLTARIGSAVQQEIDVELLVRGSTAPPRGRRSG